MPFPFHDHGNFDPFMTVASLPKLDAQSSGFVTSAERLCHDREMFKRANADLIAKVVDLHAAAALSKKQFVRCGAERDEAKRMQDHWRKQCIAAEAKLLEVMKEKSVPVWVSATHRQAVNAFLDGMLVRSDNWNKGDYIRSVSGAVVDEKGQCCDLGAFALLGGRDAAGTLYTWSIAEEPS